MNSYQISSEVNFKQVQVTDEFWSERQEVNSQSAIIHQWEMLEKSGTIDNFRIIKGDIEKFREGYVYVDSDAHKWAEAAASILITKENKTLYDNLIQYLELLREVQLEDGYIFTYNQFHFPKKRWINLQIEHELYTLGHLIEASIIAFQLTDSNAYLDLGRKAADLLVEEFQNASAKDTPGHSEIELALIKLFRLTRDNRYLELSQKFIYKRGKFFFYGLRIFRENNSQIKRANEIFEQKKNYFDAIVTQDKILSDLTLDGPFGLHLRFLLSTFTGKYFQQNKSLKKQRKPIGHCVRWGYLVTAATMLYQEIGDKKLLNTLQKAWNHMIEKRMYVTGGIGSLPLLEGFGRDYELDDRYAYNETCAAISSVFWSWEMLLSSGDAKYADLIEWQLYNSVLVGFSSDGKAYFYRNPLEVNQNLERKEWYKTACCPSNISRTLAHLAKYIYSYDENNIWIHQYIGSTTKINLDKEKIKQVEIKIESQLPWDGKSLISFECEKESKFNVNLRIPGWTKNPEIIVNGERLSDVSLEIENVDTASDLDHFKSYYIGIEREWKSKNTIELSLPMEIRIHKLHKKIRKKTTKHSFSRGPIVYCFESVDNPKIDLMHQVVNLAKEIKISNSNNMVFLTMFNPENKEIIARPYYSWGNKGKSSMRVWIQTEL